ncbi:MAG: universal stress protein [bacterium]
MLKYENIFVPVDLSAAANHALKTARTLLSPGGTVHVAHVVESLPLHVKQVLFPYAPLGEDEPEFEWEAIESARDRVQAIHKCEADMHVGEPRVIIPQLIHRNAAELIVMGTFGTGTPFPDALGSVTERVLRAARQPVLITREQHRKPIKSVLVASDLSIPSSSVVEAGLAAALATEGAIETMHVLPDPLSDDLHGFLRSQIKFDQKQAVSRNRDKIDALFERMVEAIDVPHPMRDQIGRMLGKRRIHAGDPASEILERADKDDVDLIVVGTQRPDPSGRIRIGSVATKIARRANCHVLVVPIAAAPQEEQDA